MFGNRERRRKEKRKMHFSFLCLICNKKGNQKKIYVFFLLLCPYKCERFIKFMGKYVTLCYIMLFIWALFFFVFFWNHCIPSNLPKLGGLQICEPKGNGFCPFIFFHDNQTKEKTTFLIISLFFLSSPPMGKGEVGSLKAYREEVG